MGSVSSAGIPSFMVWLCADYGLEDHMTSLREEVGQDLCGFRIRTIDGARVACCLMGEGVRVDAFVGCGEGPRR